MIIKGVRNNSNKIYVSLKSRYHSMMARCYDVNNKDYKYYGDKGVEVSDEWKTLNGFIETIDLVDGFDVEKLIKGELSLDKDSKIKDNKLYSKESCIFISSSENNKHKPNQQKNIIGISPNGDIYEFYNQSEFAREHKLTQSKISYCIYNENKIYKGWKFRIK